MAIVVTDRLHETSTANNTTFTTGSVASPATDGSPFVLCLANSYSTNRSVSSVTGLGLTWSSIIIADPNGSTRCSLWKGIGTASAGTVDITYSGATTGAGWVFLQCAGANPTTPVVGVQYAQVQSTSATPACALPATPTAGNTVIGVVTEGATSTYANALGFTVINQSWGTPNSNIGALYNTSAASATVSCTATSNAYSICAVEIAAAAGGTSFVGMVPI